MPKQPPSIPAEATPAVAQRLRADLALPGEVLIDVTCGDLVLEIPPSHAGALRLGRRKLPAGRRVLLPGDLLCHGRRRVRIAAGAMPGPPQVGTRTLARQAFGADFLGGGIPGPTLVVVEGASAGRRWPIGPGRHVLGRGLEADIVLTEPTVSRRHAEITLSGAEGSVRDLGSRHGLEVGRRRVRRRRLQPGDEIALGGARLRFHPGSEADPGGEPLPPPGRASRRLLLVAAAALLSAGGLASAAAVLVAP